MNKSNLLQKFIFYLKHLLEDCDCEIIYELGPAVGLTHYYNRCTICKQWFKPVQDDYSGIVTYKCCKEPDSFKRLKNKK